MARKKNQSGKTARQDEKDAQAEEDKSPAKEIRDLAICLGIAVLLALLIKVYLIEVFVIPTGSMEPALHGRQDGGDRVLCTKWNYWFRESGGPRRWEVFVFKFPYQQALEAEASPSPEYEGQNFIKRCIGLPNETIAIFRGDIYVLRGEAYKLERKSDAIQRTLWIPVYAETFAALATGQLKYFWKQSGGKGWEVTPQKTLRVSGGAGTHLEYQPHDRRATTLGGIPDRYVRRQAVDFECSNSGCESKKRKKQNESKKDKPRKGKGRAPAGQDPPPRTVALRQTVWNQKIAGRCPRCGRYLLEKDVVYYGRRCGLDPNGASIGKFTEGETGYHKRSTLYHLVPDLRVRFRFKAGSAATTIQVELKDDAVAWRAVLQPGAPRGTAGIALNQRDAVLPLAVPLAPDTWHEVEFYRADWQARLFLNGKLVAQKVVAVTVSSPHDLKHPKATGVMLSVTGGEVEIDDLRIDRDIYYFATGRMGNSGVFTTGSGYMAMGDNCPSSNDSRNWGAVPSGGESLRGPAIFTWWPPHRIRMIQ